MVCRLASPCGRGLIAACAHSVIGATAASKCQVKTRQAQWSTCWLWWSCKYTFWSYLCAALYFAI